jgi:hypothetical protein
VDNRDALKKLFATEDKLRKRLALVNALKRNVGKKYWQEQGLRSFPDFDAKLRASVFGE